MSSIVKSTQFVRIIKNEIEFYDKNNLKKRNKMNTKNKYCQSCGIPMHKVPQGAGTNADGSFNENYCSYCYQNGEFTFNGTASEFQEFCRQKMVEGGHSKFMAWLFSRGIKRLGRWKNKD